MQPVRDLKERRRERRVREILEAAMSVFAERGYPNATMEAIAERALLSRVALYKYFHDKEAILKALLEWKIDELAERLAAAPAGPYPEAILALAREGVRFQEENQGFFRALYTATGLPGLLRDPELRERKHRLVESVARVIEAGQRRGEARAGDPLRLAEFFLNLLFSVTVHDFFEPERPPIYDPEPIAALFLRGTLRA
jgi:AcrR family transcriptional regulator